MNFTVSQSKFHCHANLAKILKSVTLLFCLTCNYHALGDNNILKNGDFNNGLSDWLSIPEHGEAICGAKVCDERWGKCVCLTSDNSVRTNDFSQNLNAPKLAGQRVILEAKVKLVNVGDSLGDYSKARVFLLCGMPGGKTQELVLSDGYFSTKVVESNGDWVQLRDAITIPKETKSLQLRISNRMPSGKMYVDDIRLIPCKPTKIKKLSPKVWAWDFDFGRAYVIADKHIGGQDNHTDKVVLESYLLSASKIFEPTPAEKKFGFAVFKPAEPMSIRRNRTPDRSEIINTVQIRAAHGQYEPVNIAVASFEDIDSLKIGISDFKSGANVIAAKAVDVRMARQVPMLWGKKYYRIIPKLLVPAAETKITPACPQLYTLIVHVPENVVPGKYHSEINITADGKTQNLPFELEVLPFELSKGKPWAFFYYQAPMENTLHYFKDMREHGATCLLLGSANAKLYKNNDGRLQVDYSVLDKTIELYKQAGFFDMPAINPFHDGLASYVLVQLGLANGAQKVQNYGEAFYSTRSDKYPKAAQVAYKQVVQDIYAHAKKNNWPEFYFYPVDEPGEQVDIDAPLAHCWRTEAAKLEYRLAKEAVPEAKTFCTAYSLDSVKLLRPYLDRTVIKVGRISVDKALYIKRILAGWKIPFWAIDWPSWWDEFDRSRAAAGFGPARVGAELVATWVYYQPHEFEGEIDDIQNSYQRTKYSYLDEAGNIVPTLALEGIRAGINDWRYVDTAEKKIETLPEKQRKTEKKKLQKILDSNQTSELKRNAIIEMLIGLGKHV